MIGEQMAEKILVTYATKYGATAEIAEKIASALGQAGLSIELLPIQQVRDLSVYTAVVLGSAVYIGQWRKEAVKFLENNEAELAKRPLWLFSSGPTGEGDPVELVEGRHFPPKLQPVINRLQPRAIVVFHGHMNQDKMNFLEKWMIKNVDAPVGDYRDWQAIADWAAAIANELAPAHDQLR
jgi:menaquinone-dependent protoporphyrinogen oxidase